MTESEWWKATDSLPVVNWLFFDTPATERKFRLFAAACCRRIEHQITESVFLAALACVERFADGLMPQSEAAAGYQVVIRFFENRWGGMQYMVQEAEACSAVIHSISDTDMLGLPFHRSREWYESGDNFPYPWWTASSAAEATGAPDVAPSVAEMRERLSQLRLLHDIFGPLPFRDVPLSPSWLTSDVRLLAQGIYDAKAFDRMPILADALQDAGCDNDDILNHCREPIWEHVRGCWVIDLLLGKPWKER